MASDYLPSTPSTPQYIPKMWFDDYLKFLDFSKHSFIGRDDPQLTSVILFYE